MTTLPQLRNTASGRVLVKAVGTGLLRNYCGACTAMVVGLKLALPAIELAS